MRVQAGNSSGARKVAVYLIRELSTHPKRSPHQPAYMLSLYFFKGNTSVMPAKAERI